MKLSFPCVPLILLAFASWALLFACGGQSGGLGEGIVDTGVCTELSCPSNAVWNPATCTCEPSEARAPFDASDATVACPAIGCPAGSVQGVDQGKCTCLLIDAGAGGDAMLGMDAPHHDPMQDAPVYDSTFDATDAPNDAPAPSDAHDAQYNVHDAPGDAEDASDQWSPSDAPYHLLDAAPDDARYYADATLYDAPYYPDESFEAPYFPYDGAYCFPCGTGFQTTPSCQCVPCSNTCPLGEAPAAGCGGCVACPYACPPGFDRGAGCSCIPHGVDAGPIPSDAGSDADAGGMVCLLGGQNACPAGSWCALGVCPDGTTEYGCYCNADGTSTCQLACPAPPPCTIPGQGSCPYGTSCIFDSCTGDAAATALVCSCGFGGSAFCYTSPCGTIDGGIHPGLDGGGVTCLLEGYYVCNAGSWCELGVCPDGTTQYGCYCNPDGTATCKLSCPTPPPCTIPGEGVCPYGTSCTFGTCAGSVGEQLSCFCGSGGSASCFTIPCGGGDGGSGGD